MVNQHRFLHVALRLWGGRLLPKLMHITGGIGVAVSSSAAAVVAVIIVLVDSSSHVEEWDHANPDT